MSSILRWNIYKEKDPRAHWPLATRTPIKLPAALFLRILLFPFFRYSDTCENCQRNCTKLNGHKKALELDTTEDTKNLCLECRQDQIVQHHMGTNKTDSIEPLMTRTALKKTYPAISSDSIDRLIPHTTKKSPYNTYNLYAWKDCYRLIYHAYGGEQGIEAQHQISNNKRQRVSD